VVLLLDGGQVDMLVEGLFGAYFHRHEGQTRSRNRDIKKLDRTLLRQKLPRAYGNSFDDDVDRGPVVRIPGGLRAALGGVSGRGRSTVRDRWTGGRSRVEKRVFGREWASLPVFRVSALAGIALGMEREQVALFASALAQTVEEVADFEFQAIFGWPRTDMREFEARLAEVIACLGDPNTPAGKETLQ
jgi:hypothetical protein